MIQELSMKRSTNIVSVVVVSVIIVFAALIDSSGSEGNSQFKIEIDQADSFQKQHETTIQDTGKVIAI